MSWYNPWGEAARLRRMNYELRAELQKAQRRGDVFRAVVEHLTEVRHDLEQSLRTANNRIAYLETRLAGAVLRDPKTGRLLPKGKAQL